MQTLRQQLRQQRKSIPKALAYKNSAKILHNLLQNNILKYKKIAIYSSSDGEVLTSKIIDFLVSYGIEVFLPILNKEKLKFAKVGSCYKLNRFQILEPTKSKILNAKQLNLIILPLVGFDEFNNRLGMGGGFYDKTLKFRLLQKKYQYPKLYALAYDLQKTKINSNYWDIKMDKIITNTIIQKSKNV